MITGRKPKLTPAQKQTLIYQRSIGMTRAELAKLWNLDHKTVTAYVHGRHKNPALRVIE